MFLRSASVISNSFGISILLLGLFGLLWLPSCKSGGGSGNIGLDPNATGSVAVLVTDGPADQFKEIRVTVLQLELLAADDSGDRVVIFSGEKTIDLLALGDEATLFSHSSGVPVGTYSKIRMLISDIVLVNHDDTVIHPKLPGDGKLDLNPRTHFLVQPGETLIVQLDMDANKSIHIVQTGAGEKYIFRPVVFIDIISRVTTGKLVKVRGLVDAVDGENLAFNLCPFPTSIAGIALEPILDGGGGSGNGDDSTHDLDECITVFTMAGTTIYNEEALPVDFSAIQPGQQVTVVGFFALVLAEENDETRDELYDKSLVLEAEVIEKGRFLSLRGTLRLVGVVLFDLLVDPAQGFGEGTVLELEFADGVKVFSRLGAPLDLDALEDGTRVATDGVLLVSDTMPDMLRVVLVIVDTVPPGDAEKLVGTITDLNVEARTLTLVPFEGDPICVLVPEDIDIFLLIEEVEKLDSHLIDLGDLENGEEVTVFGSFESDGAGPCFVPGTILIFSG